MPFMYNKEIDRAHKFTGFMQNYGHQSGNICNVGFVFRVRDPTLMFLGLGSVININDTCSVLGSRPGPRP